MSRWSDDFKNHAIHQTLNQINGCLDIGVENTDKDIENERRRLRKVIEIIQNVLAGVDAEFFPNQLIDQIHSHIQHQNFLQQIENFSRKPRVEPLRIANNHISQYAPQIYHLGALARPSDTQKIIRKAEDAFESFARSMKDQADSTNNRLLGSEKYSEQLTQSLDNIDKKLKALDASADEKLSEWHTDFSSNQSTRAEEFSEAQISRSKEFDDLLAKWKSTIRETTDKVSSNYEKQLSDIEDNLRKHVEKVRNDVDEKHKSVARIHGLVGRDSVTGGYKRTAGDEKKAADFWRWGTIIALIFSILLVGFRFLMILRSETPLDFSLTEIIATTSVTVILLITAGYTSRQSKMHRETESKMRWFELETAALDPFIANLPVDQQQSIKAELIRRTFGRQYAEPDAAGAAKDDEAVKSVFESISNNLGKIAEKMGSN